MVVISLVNQPVFSGLRMKGRGKGRNVVLTTKLAITVTGHVN